MYDLVLCTHFLHFNYYKCSDVTPKLFHFGNMKGVLASQAKYVVRRQDDPTKWRLCTYEGYSSTKKVWLPSKGLLQTLTIAESFSASSEQEYLHHDYFIKPVLMTNSGASTIFAEGETPMSIARMIEISKHVEQIWWQRCLMIVQQIAKRPYIMLSNLQVPPTRIAIWIIVVAALC